MYLLATICLLNFLTVRGTEHTVATTALENYAGEQTKVKKNAEFTTCQTNYETKYKDAKWEQKDIDKTQLKDECYVQEDNVCVATNKSMTKYLEGLKDQAKDVCTIKQNAEVIECKAKLVGNKDCKADCAKLSPSSASSLTTTALLAMTTLAFVSM
jgi:hypothetical protein